MQAATLVLLSASMFRFQTPSLCLLSTTSGSSDFGKKIGDLKTERKGKEYEIYESI